MGDSELKPLQFEALQVHDTLSVWRKSVPKCRLGSVVSGLLRSRAASHSLTGTMHDLLVSDEQVLYVSVENFNKWSALIQGEFSLRPSTLWCMLEGI